ncbi:MAG: cell division protein FtsZ [Alphaproteobacteria bacterium]
MTIKLSMPNVESELKPRITVVGVGGAGGNAVNNMIDSNLAGVEFLVCNTDAQALGQSNADRCIQLGVNITQGLGAGARPEVGRAAAEEALEEVLDHLAGSHMVFITAGMGGGTGTGAAPVIARATREQGILTVGVVTKPFHFEGMQRMRLAEAGIDELTQYVDTLIIIPNQNLFRVANEKTTFADAFHMADNVLYSGVRGVTDLMVMPGLINLDFADVRTVMSEMGKAMMGTGEAEGERRAIEAAEAAISNPLLEDITMEGARGVLINITGGPDMTLFEVDEAANRIREEVDPEADILFGSTFEPDMEGKIRVSVVATGIDAAEMKTRPEPLRSPTMTARAAATAPAAPAPARPTEAISPIAEAEQADVAQEPEYVADMAEEIEVDIVADADMPATVAVEPQPVAARPEPQPSRVEPSIAFRRPEAAPAVAAPAPAPVAAARPAAVPGRTDPAGRRVPFIPPKPMTPNTAAGKDDREPSFIAPRSAEHVNDLGQPSRRRSLFERMTGVSRREPGEAAPAASREPVEPRLQGNMPPRAEPPAAKAMPENPPARVQPEPAPQKAKQATSEEEVLEIPAFLRRQAN